MGAVKIDSGCVAPSSGVSPPSSGASLPSGRSLPPLYFPSPPNFPKGDLTMWSIDRIEGDFALCENTVTG